MTAAHSDSGLDAARPLKVCCYAAVKDTSLFDLVEFYRQDIRALEELGHDVRLAHHPLQLHSDDDVYWVWWPTSGAPAVLWARLRRRPAVLLAAISDRDTTVSGLPAQPRWKRAAARLSFRLADLTLVPSEDARLGLDRYKVRALRTAPLAVDTDFYRPGPRRDGTPYVLTISHLTRDNVERKRLLDVVRTAAAVREQGSELQFVIVGGREDAAPIVEAEVDRLGLQDRVTLVGRVSAEEKRRLLQGATVYLQPTQYESFGVAIAEAMASGIPVVTNDIGAVGDVVGDTGTMLPPDAGPHEFAEALLATALQPDYANATRARQRVVERFSYLARRQEIEAALDAVMGARLPMTRGATA
jgi:glycosyltransferase involved in cell wall biosynthesis